MTSQYFSSKTIGRSLKEVAVDLIQTNQEDIISRWYHSDHATDLFTWVDKGKNVIKQQLCFNGQVVEWNCLEGLKTGVIIESDLENSTGTEKEENIAKSESIKFDVNPHESSVKMAVSILDHFNAEDWLRQQIVENFCNPANIKTMAPEDFVKRFGISLKNYHRPDHGFWDSVKKTFHSLFKKTG